MLRIATWNVEYADKAATNWRRREVMRRFAADVWILTETHDALKPPGGFIAKHSGQRPYYGTRVRKGSRWVSIWSRYRIVARPRVRGGDPERTTIALIKTPIGDLLVYGTVMPWKDDKGRYGRSDAVGWSEHHRSIPMQIAEWKKLRQRFPTAFLCVAGDFNTDLGTGAYYGTKRGIDLLRNGMKACGASVVTKPGGLKKARWNIHRSTTSPYHSVCGSERV